MKLSKKNLLYFAFVIALSSMLGSLYFSEILKFVPCALCWWQRIAMYPIVFILFVGILTKDKNIFSFVFPLSLFGLLVSIYQNLLYYSVLTEAASPCVVGASCTSRFFQLFGYLDIPQLSFLSFFAITIMMLIYRKLK